MFMQMLGWVKMAKRFEARDIGTFLRSQLYRVRTGQGTFNPFAS